MKYNIKVPVSDIRIRKQTGLGKCFFQLFHHVYIMIYNHTIIRVLILWRNLKYKKQIMMHPQFDVWRIILNNIYSLNIFIPSSCELLEFRIIEPSESKDENVSNLLFNLGYLFKHKAIS